MDLYEVYLNNNTCTNNNSDSYLPNIKEFYICTWKKNTIFFKKYIREIGYDCFPIVAKEINNELYDLITNEIIVEDLSGTYKGLSYYKKIKLDQNTISLYNLSYRSLTHNDIERYKKELYSVKEGSINKTLKLKK